MIGKFFKAFCQTEPELVSDEFLSTLLKKVAHDASVLIAEIDAKNAQEVPVAGEGSHNAWTSWV